MAFDREIVIPLFAIIQRGKMKKEYAKNKNYILQKKLPFQTAFLIV